MASRADLVRVWSQAIAIVLVPLVVAYVGQRYTSASHDRDIQARFVELAISILRERPTESTRRVREWAVRVVDQYSGVALSDSTKNDLIERAPLPASSSGLMSIQAPTMSIRNAKLALNALKLFDGPFDNNYTPAFRDALVQFQKDHAIPTDGNLGPATALALNWYLPEIPASSLQKGMRVR
jgi:murein L,D-transpeptidase YcbB/YkuD